MCDVRIFSAGEAFRGANEIKRMKMRFVVDGKGQKILAIYKRTGPCTDWW